MISIINEFACQLRLVRLSITISKHFFLGESSSMAVRISYFNLLKLIHTYHIGKLHTLLGRRGE